MTRLESPTAAEGLVESEDLEDRISRIHRVCHVFRRGYDDGAFTFKELRGACRLLSTLIRPFNRDLGDLCLLASHAENTAQFKPICQMGRQQWRPIKVAEGKVNDYDSKRS